MARRSGKTDKSTDRLYQDFSVMRRPPTAGLVVLVAIYLTTSVLVNLTSRSEGVVELMGHMVPIRTIAGSVSSLSNISIILTVLFYGKLGFAIALGLLLLQFPLLASMIAAGNVSVLPGITTNLLTIVATVLIHLNDERSRRYRMSILDQAVTDRLTGLPNRFACSELVEHLVRRGSKFAVACLNLNNFKSINATMGTVTGDGVLVEVASRVRAVTEGVRAKASDDVTHHGGDEFCLIIRSFESEEDLLSILRLYETAIEQMITLDGCDYRLTASIGYALFPADADTADKMLSYADMAMHEAKLNKTGDQRVLRYHAGMNDLERAMEVERKIRDALAGDTISFNLQPQFDMSHRLCGFEALARMRDADGNIVSPGEFIPVAEQCGLVDQIDNVVFRKSASFFGQLVRETQTDITLSVNVSVRHLMKNDFLDELRAIIEEYGIPTSQLEIEITESVMIDSAERAIACIHEIKEMGIKIAIDDFGTGYSSLSYLTSLPADTLKVDKSFIDNMNRSASSKQYVAAIISIGHVLSFSVISEGVEEAEQLETLRNIGCDYVQGFIWGRPMEAEAARELVMAA